MSDINHFQLVEGDVDSLTCPSCSSKLKLNSTYIRILNDNGSLRIPCFVCETPLKISYILKKLHIRLE